MTAVVAQDTASDQPKQLARRRLSRNLDLPKRQAGRVVQSRADHHSFNRSFIQLTVLHTWNLLVSMQMLTLVLSNPTGVKQVEVSSYS